MKTRYFFGWSNFKWLLKELIAIYSNKSSFFSKKRLESGFAFLVGQLGMITYFIFHLEELNMPDVLFWAAAEFAIAGYVLNQIQKEKKTEVVSNSDTIIN